MKMRYYSRIIMLNQNMSFASVRPLAEAFRSRKLILYQ